MVLVLIIQGGFSLRIPIIIILIIIVSIIGIHRLGSKIELVLELEPELGRSLRENLEAINKSQHGDTFV